MAWGSLGCGSLGSCIVRVFGLTGVYDLRQVPSIDEMVPLNPKRNSSFSKGAALLVTTHGTARVGSAEVRLPLLVRCRREC